MQGGSYKILWVLTHLMVALAGTALSAYGLAENRSDPNPQPHSVTLTWTPVANAKSYNIYRGEVSGGPYEKIGSSSTAKYVDTPVPGGTTLYYVVTTVNSTGESKCSSETKAVVP
jgi:fibronectin type 3 domain-containing protein